jgi:hypothetical protein
MTDWACFDCGRDTWDEYFMLDNALWERTTTIRSRSAMLCVGCVERRLGRRLRRRDFTDVPINEPQFPWEKSVRLLSRLAAS